MQYFARRGYSMDSNLDERRLTTPPADLHALIVDLPRTEDFAELPSLKPR